MNENLIRFIRDCMCKAVSASEGVLRINRSTSPRDKKTGEHPVCHGNFTCAECPFSLDNSLKMFLDWMREQSKLVAKNEDGDAITFFMTICGREYEARRDSVRRAATA